MKSEVGDLEDRDGRLGNLSADTMEISQRFVSILLTLSCNTRALSSWEKGRINYV